MTIPRPAVDEFAPFYAGYVAEAPDADILTTLEEQGAEAAALFREHTARFDHRYAPGKWSLAEVAGHLADCERVFAYRALWIARGDPAPLPGFDENAWMPFALFGKRDHDSVITELESVRAATLTLFRGLPEESYARRGTASDTPVTVRALAWIIAGHERHHLRIVRDRYLR